MITLISPLLSITFVVLLKTVCQKPFRFAWNSSSNYDTTSILFYARNCTENIMMTMESEESCAAIQEGQKVEKLPLCPWSVANFPQKKLEKTLSRVCLIYNDLGEYWVGVRCV